MIHRDVSVLILYDAEGNILLQQRSDTARANRGMWGFFGGGIDGGETPEQAVLREAKEELELVPESPVKIDESVNEGQYPGYLGTMHVFIARYRGEHLALREGKAKGWFPVVKALELDISERDRDVLRRTQDRFLRR